MQPERRGRFAQNSLRTSVERNEAKRNVTSPDDDDDGRPTKTTWTATVVADPLQPHMSVAVAIFDVPHDDK